MGICESAKFDQGKVGGIFSTLLNIVTVDKFVVYVLHVFVSYLSVLTFCLLVLTATLQIGNIQTTAALSISGRLDKSILWLWEMFLLLDDSQVNFLTLSVEF